MTKSSQTNQGLSEQCRLVHSAWNGLTKAWTLPVIHTLGLGGPARFNELKRRIVGINATSLSERLNEMEHRRIIERKVYPETPPRVEYSLTKKGLEFYEVLCNLAEWVIKWDKQPPAIPETTRQRKTPSPPSPS